MKFSTAATLAILCAMAPRSSAAITDDGTRI
jgi:hypothetical protein